MKISQISNAALILLAALAAAPAAGGADMVAPAEISVHDTPTVKVLPSGVSIDIPGDSPRHVTVFAITGQVVKDFTAQPGTSSIDLRPGQYVVRVDRLSVKIVVK